MANQHFYFYFPSLCVLNSNPERLHCDSIITRSSVSREKIPVIKDCIIYTRPLFKLIKVVNATSLPGFHIRKQMVWDISHSVFSCKVITHEIFINRGINRCMLVKQLSCNWFNVFFHSDTYVKWFIWWRKCVCMYVSVLKIETVRVQASPLPWQAEVTVL